LAQLAQFLCQNFPPRLICKKSKPQKPLILRWNFTIRGVGIAQAKEVSSEQKI